MTTGPMVGSPRRDTFAVMPVVDYEPPTRNVPRCRQSSHAPSRPHTPSAARRLSGRPPVASAEAVMSVPMRQAAMFADAALRRVLEVIDRRRPVAQLRSLLAPSLVDSVLSVSRAVTPPEGVATLRRMRLQPVGSDAPGTAAEVFGTYRRGDRIHAIACRVEQLCVGKEARWLVVALHIG
ncbi:Rv3235 family protein [Mycobacterium simulans]|nr:Rv3235 family protein [Mycobacterium simulans]